MKRFNYQRRTYVFNDGHDVKSKNRKLCCENNLTSYLHIISSLIKKELNFEFNADREINERTNIKLRRPTDTV